MTEWSSLLINVARVRRQLAPAELKRRSQSDTTIPIDATVEANGLEITTSRIPEGSDVHVSGAAHTTLSGIEVRATVASSWEGECRRCLESVTEPIELDLVVTFAPDGEGNDDADIYPITGDVIDVGDVVREELMLALPLTPLCSPDCDGADPDRFPTTTTIDITDASSEPAIDPRWAALSELTFDDEEDEEVSIDEESDEQGTM